MSLDSGSLPAEWADFLHDLDPLLPERVSLVCIGGFVLRVMYRIPRITADIDCISILPFHDLEELAGRESPLAKKYRVHLQYVAVTTMPLNYEDRLTELFPRRFEKLRIYVPDAYDLILSKVERNSPKDREDVQYLAKTAQLNPIVLRERYDRELRPLLANEARHDLTIKLWSELFPPASANCS
jgi:Nucleotidyltransferase of unknown function (DUF6036)